MVHVKYDSIALSAETFCCAYNFESTCLCNGILNCLRDLSEEERLIVHSFIRLVPSGFSNPLKICSAHQSHVKKISKRKECGVAAHLGTGAVHTSKTRWGVDV